MMTTKLINEQIDDYLRSADIQEVSRHKYRDNLHLYVSWLTRNVDDVHQVTKADFIRYKQYLLDQRLSASTIENYLVVVRQFYRYLSEMGEATDITQGVRSPKQQPGFRKKYLVPDDMARLLMAIDRSTIQGKRSFAIINLMLHTGVRCIEVSRLNVGDIKSPEKIMVQDKGYSHADRPVAITEDIHTAIMLYLNERDDVSLRDPLFVNHSCASMNTRYTPISISKLVKRLMRSIALDDGKLTAHSLRHSFAINSIKCGATVFQISKTLGHRSISTTELYLRAVEEEQSAEGTPVRLLADLIKKAKKNLNTDQNEPISNP